MTLQQDITIRIKDFGSMRNHGRLDDNQLEVIMNYLFDGEYLKTRPPYKRVMTNATSGNFMPIGNGTYATATNTEMLFALSNGSLWTLRGENQAPVELTIGGANPFNTNITHVRMEQVLNLLYIIGYGGSQTYKVLEYNGSTLTDRTSKLPSGCQNPTSIKIYGGTRIVLGDEEGEIDISKSDVDLSNASPFDTSNGAFSEVVTRGDGATVSALAVTNGILAIFKQRLRDKKTSSSRISGATSAEFELRQISPTTGFLGNSAIEIGSDILGISYSGFDFLKVLDQLGEGAINSSNISGGRFTQEIPDYILTTVQGIRYDRANLIVSEYDDLRKNVIFSVPFGDNTTYNNLMIVLNLTEGQYRFSLLSGTAQFFYKANGFIYFINHKGEIWKMFSENEDSYEEDEYHKLLVTKWFDFLAEDERVGIQVPINARVQSFAMDIEAESNGKDIDMFYEYERYDKKNGNILIESNRFVGDNREYKSAKKNVLWVDSKIPTKTDLTIANLDTADSRRSKRAILALSVDKETRRVRFITSDYSTGLGNMHKIRELVMKARPSEVKE